MMKDPVIFKRGMLMPGRRYANSKDVLTEYEFAELEEFRMNVFSTPEKFNAVREKIMSRPNGIVELGMVYPSWVIHFLPNK